MNSIVFTNVNKSYPLYHYLGSGIKNILLNPGSLMNFFSIKKVQAIADLNFSVEQGTTLAVIGDNGAGKSTILGMIAGVISPSSGVVQVEGSVFPMLELGAGFHPELSGRENLIMNGVLLGYSKKYMESVSDEIISFSGLEEFIDEPIRIYSSGMLARLGFSILSKINPDILLIDEVFAVGDHDFRVKCQHTLNEFKSRNVTSVVVSHDLDYLREFCDKAMWIEGHELKMYDDVGYVIDKYLEFRNLCQDNHI